MRYSSVAVVGLNQTGLPLALRYCQAGCTVVGFDSDELALRNIRNGYSNLSNVADELIADYINQSFTVSNDYSQIVHCDAVIVSVALDVDANHSPNTSAINDAVRAVRKYASKGILVAIQSNVYPGYTRDEACQILQQDGWQVGKDFHLVYSPNWEKLDTNFEPRPAKSRVLGAMTDACMERGLALFKETENNLIPVMSTTNAELAKVLEDTYRMVNFGLVNEMKMIADKLDADIHEVIRAMATKRDGCRPHFPGPGIGGKTLPTMPQYLNWKARHLGVPSQFVQLASQVNQSVSDWVVVKVAEALNERKKSINGSKILVLGAAYRKNIADTSRSPAINLMKILSLKGALVSYSDPWVQELKAMAHFRAGAKSMPLLPETLSQFDLVLLATDHDDFDYDDILAHSNLIVDTRGRFDSSLEKVVMA